MQEKILTYANGEGQRLMYSEEILKPDANGEYRCKRNELKQEDFLQMSQKSPAMMYDKDEHHGGDDVGLWARGKLSKHKYLIRKVDG